MVRFCSCLPSMSSPRGRVTGDMLRTTFVEPPSSTAHTASPGPGLLKVMDTATAFNINSDPPTWPQTTTAPSSAGRPSRALGPDQCVARIAV
jgi:hypothetical protein